MKAPYQYPEHRKYLNDLDWAAAQVQGPPNYHIGDVVEFHEGGFGVVDEVSEPRDGWPSSYSVAFVPGLPKAPRNAWYYEGDIKRLVGGSPLRNTTCGTGSQSN